MDTWLDYSIPGPVLLIAFCALGYIFWILIPWFVRLPLLLIWGVSCLIGLGMATVGHYLQRWGFGLLDICSIYPRTLREKQRERRAT